MANEIRECDRKWTDKNISCVQDGRRIRRLAVLCESKKKQISTRNHVRIGNEFLVSEDNITYYQLATVLMYM
jgi:hypothetical protein